MNFYSNGKLLITGEYLVLDGAKSLALPTKQGQSMTVKINADNKNGLITWHSFDENNNIWFGCEIDKKTFKVIKSTNVNIAITLTRIFQEVRKLKNDFLILDNNIQISTKLSFNTSWGLGTSSTLINNIASWAKVDAFQLQFKIFGGSAYDIACAQHDNPIVYSLNKQEPIVKEVAFNPQFKSQLFFIHLNQKQNSRDAIKNYRKNKLTNSNLIESISEITAQIVRTNSLTEFEYLINKHETIISKSIGIEPIQKSLFKDYFGRIKSLGAWGGDFILATGNSDSLSYFKKKGYQTILTYGNMIK